MRYGETGAGCDRATRRASCSTRWSAGSALFGFGWADTTATQVYTVHDIHPFLADEIVRRGAARSGVAWHYARPPVQMLEYEMDCRAVRAGDVAAI